MTTEQINLACGHTEGTLRLTIADTSEMWLQMSSKEQGHVIRLFRPDGTPLLLDPNPDVTPTEALKLCQLMVRMACGRIADQGFSGRHSIQDFIETNGLCRHFRKVSD